MTAVAGLYVTTVHGTNDPKGPWAQEDGNLHRAVALNFPNLRGWNPFDWTAKNDQADRIAAGARLVDSILTFRQQHPDSLHVIIAHSHGGNIALYATQDPRLNATVAAAITVGTPYFHAIQRNAYTVVRGIAHALLPAAALAAFMPFIAAERLLASEALPPLARAALAIGIAILSFAAYIALLVKLSRRNIPTHHAEAAAVAVQSLRGVGKPDCPFHCIWRADDEVQAGAVAIDAVTTILAFVRRPMFLLALWGILSTWFWISPFALPSLETTWPLSYLGGSPFGSAFLAGLNAMLPAALAVIAFSLVCDLLQFALLKSALRWAYGLPHVPLSLAPYLRVLPGLTPIQAANVSFYELNRPPQMSLNHSLDDDPQFIKCVLTILDEVLAAKA